jgi:hypothetical protein
MNKRFLKVLVAVNAALLVGLALVSVTEAQRTSDSEFNRPGKYVMLPATTNQFQEDVVYIFSEKSGKIVGLRYRSAGNRGEFEIVSGRNVQLDLSRLP